MQTAQWKPTPKAEELLSGTSPKENKEKVQGETREKITELLEKKPEFFRIILAIIEFKRLATHRRSGAKVRYDEAAPGLLKMIQDYKAKIEEGSLEKDILEIIINPENHGRMVGLLEEALGIQGELERIKSKEGLGEIHTITNRIVQGIIGRRTRRIDMLGMNAGAKLLEQELRMIESKYLMN